MALCEKYKKEIAVGNRVCPDPQIYCAFRTACIIYAVFEEGLDEERKGKEVQH